MHPLPRDRGRGGRLDAPLDALGGPTPTVLAYAPPSQKKRKNLDALPRRVWLEVGPRLWLSHDGELLLLATDHDLLIENLLRGA